MCCIHPNSWYFMFIPHVNPVVLYIYIYHCVAFFVCTNHLVLHKVFFFFGVCVFWYPMWTEERKNVHGENVPFYKGTFRSFQEDWPSPWLFTVQVDKIELHEDLCQLHIPLTSFCVNGAPASYHLHPTWPQLLASRTPNNYCAHLVGCSLSKPLITC